MYRNTLCMCIYTMSIHSVYLVSDLEGSAVRISLVHRPRTCLTVPRPPTKGLQSLLVPADALGACRASHGHGHGHSSHSGATVCEREREPERELIRNLP